MELSRIFALARRVMRQFMRDHRTVAMLIFAPILVLTIGALLFRADPAAISLGVVNEDEGATLPGAGTLTIGERIVEALGDGAYFDVMPVESGEVDARLRDGTVEAVLVLPPSFSTDFLATRQAALDLHLEGSNPTRSQMIRARVMEAGMTALAGLAAPGANTGGEGNAASATLPLTLTTSYLFAGEAFDTMDFIAPVYIAFLVMFFVFLLTCVSFLRERLQGTMERLLATPATRVEMVLGYMLGLSLFALVQVSVILFFTIWALDIHYVGSLGLVFLVMVLLALVGVSMGMLASVFARNEFQVLQFIPLVIIPQVLLAGTFWAVEDMPAFLRPFSYIMPLTYANWALRDVMLKGFGLGDIWPYLLVLLCAIMALTGVGALALRREIA